MNTAVGAIIGLVGTIAAYVLAYDLWAQATGHQTISGQVHVWMLNQVAGPIVAGILIGVPVAFAYHFLINR